jgi:hypothetical protein
MYVANHLSVLGGLYGVLAGSFSDISENLDISNLEEKLLRMSIRFRAEERGNLELK